MQPESSDTNLDEPVRELLAAAVAAGIQMTVEDATAMVTAVERNCSYARVTRSLISKADEPAHVFTPSSQPEGPNA